MNTTSYILAAIMGTMTAGAGFASFNGIGLSQPEKQPVSIREGSVQNADGSRSYGMFFLRGGGVHGGK